MVKRNVPVRILLSVYRVWNKGLATIAPMCMVGLVTQSEEKSRNVTSPSHKVESKEVLDSGEKYSLANTVQLKSK